MVERRDPEFGEGGLLLIVDILIFRMGTYFDHKFVNSLSPEKHNSTHQIILDLDRSDRPLVGAIGSLHSDFSLNTSFNLKSPIQKLFLQS